MKKIFKCPNCPQMSTRHWNLKRHIERKHKIGQPTMLYISGKSAFNFSAASDIHHSYLVQDRNYALRKMWTDDSIAITSSMKNNYPKTGVDKWLDRLSQIQEMLL